jgi:ribosomal protein S18 acetylase RimI-like enzyme
MMPAYAATMAVAFSDSSDLEVFPKLASKDGCGNIMADLVALEGFFTGASWLAFFNREPCAIILTGLAGREGVASIRVVGVAPRHRRIKIGSQLVNKALWALHDRKFKRAIVKVSRHNRAGVMFFRSMEFHIESSQEYL